MLRALIKSFNGYSEAFYARATRPHRDRICHCDHYGIVGTSSPRDGRRRHCRYSVSGMQMAPSWMVICRLIRPAGRKLLTILILAWRECAELFAAIPARFLRQLARPWNKGSDFKIFFPGKKKLLPRNGPSISSFLEIFYFTFNYQNIHWQVATKIIR